MNSTLSNKEIDVAAKNLLEHVFGDIGSIKLPVDIDRVVKYCDLSVQRGHFAEPNIRGALVRKERRIMLSDDSPFQEKNYTAAHEIGHFKLHDMPYDIMISLDHLFDDSDPHEQEAHRFAAALTMPEQKVREWWRLTSETSLLAKVFGVPEIVDQYRIRQLGLK
jgi:Zn-dependent peptidase ImmA (M78 family)